jgi:tRNA modification GTPase
VTSIYALSSGHGKAGVAVIRISGPQTGFVLHAMASGIPEPRVVRLTAIRNPETGDVLDRGLVLWFPAPRSFTGEDMAELHVHGGRAVLEAVLQALAGLTGLRLAEPGEFARRAFENGKLDLTAAEGLADLIDAETEAQRRQALRQADGVLRLLYDGWRERLIAASAALEADLDFADEADVPESIAATARPAVEALAREIAAHLQDARGEILRDGFHVVIAGPPNAGKSSLLNALARRDAAIVSAEAGTTRDIIEVRLDIGGYPVVLMDTAGIREAGGEIEREGIRRTLDRMRGADLVLWMEDASQPATAPHTAPEAEDSAPVIRIASKVDLSASRSQGEVVPISAKTGEGLDRLLDALLDHIRNRLASTEGATITRARHRAGLTEAHDALLDFLAGDANAIELRAEDLRRAATAIGRITGRVDVEDILDKIFADFCIGK